MKIGCLTESGLLLEELKGLFSGNKEGLQHFASFADLSANVGSLDLIVDTRSVINAQEIAFYAELNGVEVWLNTTSASIKEQVLNSGMPFFAVFAGITAWPGFIANQPIEIAYCRAADRALTEETLSLCGIQAIFVPDRPGLVRARVISMIINEAYFAFQEGAASKEEVDLAMKLGTNYPFGPFEWAEKIGKAAICNLLDAIRDETGDPRYSVARLLREEANQELLLNLSN